MGKGVKMLLRMCDEMMEIGLCQGLVRSSSEEREVGWEQVLKGFVRAKEITFEAIHGESWA